MATAYFTTLDLSPYLVDKDTGAPLSGGFINFWKDADRTVPKLVYEKQNVGADPVTGNPVYQFVPLTDPLIVSGVGTLQNANGVNVAVYYYPFDVDGNEELYFVQVYNYLGVEQLTREGWGFPSSAGGGGGDGGTGSSENMVSNPQFVVVNFNPLLGLDLAFTGSGTVNVPIAPDWTLEIIHAGAGNVVIGRDPVAGSSNYSTNPPYILSINPGNNISSLKLIQQLPHNPGIWTPKTAGMGGFIGTNILLGPTTQAVVRYAPSVGAPTTLLSDNNASANYVEYTNTVQLTPSTNTDLSTVGYVNLEIQLSNTVPSFLSSVQVLSLATNITGIQYNEETVNRQIDHLYNYYNEKLQFKPLKSYLVGWDFHLNPAQRFGDSIAAQAIGANKSYISWDQTILFQSVDSAITVTRAASGAMRTTLAQTAQIAVIQYLDQEDVRAILNGSKSVNVSALSNVNGIKTTVSLWYTTDGSLPDLNAGTNESIVATLDANGKPATFNGTWSEVPRSNLGDAVFDINTSANTTYNSYGNSGWDMLGAAAVNTATFFAIVVGTESITAADYVEWDSISTVDGDIPTIPAPQTANEVLEDCRWYFGKSYLPNVAPGTITPVNSYFAKMQCIYDGISMFQLYWQSFMIEYPSSMRVPPGITLYSVTDGTAAVVDPYINATGSPSEGARFPVSLWGNNLGGGSTIGTDRAIFVTNTLTAAGIQQPPGGIGTEAFINFQFALEAGLGLV